MNTGLIMRAALYSLFFFATSCITINIYFPAAAVEKAADRIVEEVWGEQGDKPEKGNQEKQGEQQSLLDSMKLVLSLAGPGDAFAQKADINVTTPAIRALKSSIQQRAASIKPYMDSGNVGISNAGLLVIRDSTGLNLKSKAALTRLIDAENRDRNALYKEIAKANNFSPDRVDDIRKIFAGSWIKQAKQGWWVQDPQGNWKQK